jgi:hypothetical protein
VQEVIQSNQGLIRVSGARELREQGLNRMPRRNPFEKLRRTRQGREPQFRQRGEAAAGP